MARWLARDWVVRKLSRSPRIRAVDAAVGDGGVTIVLLLRLSPVVPFALLN